MAVQAGKEGEVKKEERSGDGPVDVTGPEEVAVDVMGGGNIGDLGVDVLADVVDGNSGVSGHGEVGDCGGGGDEGSNDVEKTLLLEGC